MRALPAEDQLPRRLFTVDEVERMVDAGIIDEDEHVELLDGELVVVTPQGPPHISRVAELARRLDRAYDGIAHVRPQGPLMVRPRSMPEPDLAVVRRAPRDYRARHPVGADTLLVVEIARSSQVLDRRKIRIYAVARVPVYWLIDLGKRRLHVFARPAAGGLYEASDVLAPGQDVGLPGLDARWPVAELVD